MRTARRLGVGQAGQDALDLLERADADLVPVEEVVLEPREGLVGLLAGRPLVADPVDDRLQDRQAVAPGLELVPLLEEGVDLGQELRFARCGHGRLECAVVEVNGAEA